MSIAEVAEQQRCAEHPARLAHDTCPHCDRPRCAADSAQYGAWCAVCRLEAPPRRPASRGELAIRAALATVPVIVIGGWIVTQYVNDHLFSVIAPGLLGLAASWLASVATTRAGGGTMLPVVVSVGASLLGTALGFHLVPGGRQSVVHPLTVVGAPYGCAVIGALAWPVLFGVSGKRPASSAV